jgi:hypothetical protein
MNRHVRAYFVDMFVITEHVIHRCSLTLGQFNSERVDLLVTLFHQSNLMSNLSLASNHFKTKFERLLTCRADDEHTFHDTPLNRIELAVIIHFKLKYLNRLSNTSQPNASMSNVRLSIDDELNLAYCFLLAQIDDRLTALQLDELRFFLKISLSVQNLFDIYKFYNETNMSKFFTVLLQCGYLGKYHVSLDKLIRDFLVFLKRYDDFLVDFLDMFPLLSHEPNYRMETDAIINQDETNEISAYVSQFLTKGHEPTKSDTRSSIVTTGKNNFNERRSTSNQLATSNVPTKGLCVIVNIDEFIASNAMHHPARIGSDKDVTLIKIIFNQLNFTVLECCYNFKKKDFDDAMTHINDRHIFGGFDCLVMFIMSHG